MSKILICGDSFSADWTLKYTGHGWPNLIAKDHDVTNLSQAGCSEYKIYLQLKSIDLNEFDFVIVSHTSPNRIYVKDHPVHSNDILHKHSDLIYSDIKEHSKTDTSLISIVDFYEKYVDIEYFEFIHFLICREIDSMCSDLNVLHIAHIDWDKLYKFPNMINFFNVFNNHRGLLNHYSDRGNAIVYKQIMKHYE